MSTALFVLRAAFVLPQIQTLSDRHQNGRADARLQQGKNPDLQLLGQRDDDAFWAADVTEQVLILVPR